MYRQSMNLDLHLSHIDFFSLIIIIIIPGDAAVSGKPGEGIHHLLLDEVDGHGEHRQPQEDVDHTDQELVLAVR